LKIRQVQWIEPQAMNVPTEVSRAAGGHPWVAETLARRGITTFDQARAFLDPVFYTPAASTDLPDMLYAAERIQKAIQGGEKIGVWGDFDVDGQTSTALLVDGLQHLGAQMSYHIPVRAQESHGVNLNYLPQFLDQGMQVLITCDTGITAHEAAQYAQQRGVEMLITDHHSLPPELPAAKAVINPHRLATGHALSYLCGAGTAYKLLEMVYTLFGRAGEAECYLDLVALGTVADMARLSGDCRYLVQRGLELLRHQTRPAIQKILDLAEVKAASLNEEHIGFIIAPRLNALGRLQDANPAVEFLTTQDEGFIQRIAYQLEGLNSQRKLLCDQVLKGAQAQIESNPALLNEAVLVLSHPQWHAGVIGIAASRLVELYHRPTVLIATPKGEAGRASARSIDGINITQAIAANQHLLLNFGGHPMAAGLSLQPEKINEFRRALNRTVESGAAGSAEALKLEIDAIVPLGEVTLNLVEELDRLAPFGPGNPALVLGCLDVNIQNASIFGKTGEHLRLTVEDRQGSVRPVFWWQGAGADIAERQVDLAYTARAANFRGQIEVQIEFVNLRTRPDSVQVSTKPSSVCMDYRNEGDPLQRLKEYAAEGVVIWREGENTPEVEGCGRGELRPACVLVIWSIPPGRAELEAVLDVVEPQTVLLFGRTPATDTAEGFLKRLAGVVRFALQKHAGKVTMVELAAATAQKEITVHKGLDWLACRGFIEIQVDAEGVVQMQRGTAPNPDQQAGIEAELRLLLQETAAFRKFYVRAPVEAISKRFMNQK
jgi:single-stranded-DNA-specific exonuclease